MASIANTFILLKARKFFVGGNFKMNGKLEEIKVIVDRLNNNAINPAVGKFLPSSFSITL
jgi:hypothetical protein